jgi:predicted CXXCH cytochrome family protein
LSKKIYLLTVLLVSLLLIMKAGIVLSQAADSTEPLAADSTEPLAADSAEPQSIHQRASICWEDFEATFPDEPLICQDVCNRCHTEATVIQGQSGNPEAFTTNQKYPEDPDDEVNWDTIGLLQQSCRDCHIKEIEPDTNHAIFVEHEVNYSENFKETELKLFDGHILCTTCHSPHSGNVALLRIPNHGSGLCIDCHTT